MVALSEALKSNTTLMELNMFSEHKRNNTQMASTNNQLFSNLIKSTGNNIRYAGTASLFDALEPSITFTEPHLSCEHQ